MSTNLIQPPELENLAPQEWTPPLPPTDLIFDDGVPLESNRHRIAINVLIEAIYEALQERDDFFAGGNMFVYYSSKQARNQDFRGPDFFVVLDVDGTKERQGWVVWEEEGRYPDVIVELLSPTTAKQDKTEKKKIYEQTFRTQYYFIYDPFQPDSFQGWNLGANRQYQEIIPNEQGWLWCEILGLWLGKWSGTIYQENATWLRFYDQEENLILLGTERAQKEQQAKEQALAALAQERQQTEKLRDRLKSLGLDQEQ